MNEQFDQVSEGLTFSFGERNNARVSRTLSVVQHDGETYAQARERTVAQVRKEIADGVDFWMMRCGSRPEFYDGPKWGAWREYSKPPRILVAPMPDGDVDDFPGWHRQATDFPLVYVEGYAVRLQHDIPGSVIVRCESAAEVEKLPKASNDGILF